MERLLISYGYVLLLVRLLVRLLACVGGGRETGSEYVCVTASDNPPL